MTSAESPVSVVVPVYNDVENLLRAVRCLLDQTLPPRKIVVVDDGSTDGSARRAADLDPTVLYVHKTNGGPASARNVGVRLVESDFVAFTDSDCRPAEDWLACLVDGFDEPQVAGVGGSVKTAVPGTTGEFVDVREMLEPKRETDGSISYVVTANACFRRQAMVEAGLFDERFRRPGGEELDLCRRLRARGYVFRYIPTAQVLHVHRQTARSLLRTIANYGEGHYLLASIWPEYRIRHPLLGLCRALVAMHGLGKRIVRYGRTYGVRKGLAFGLLDHLYIPAFLVGYLRGRIGGIRK